MRVHTSVTTSFCYLSLFTLSPQVFNFASSRFGQLQDNTILPTIRSYYCHMLFQVLPDVYLQLNDANLFLEYDTYVSASFVFDKMFPTCKILLKKLDVCNDIHVLCITYTSLLYYRH